VPRTPQDHFVPKAYLRGFTVEYLDRRKGGVLIVYYPGLGWVHRLSINDYVACEPEFYDNHPIDKHWSRTIEQSWPQVRTALKNKEMSRELLDALFWFVAAQFIRTQRFMNLVAQRISFQQANIKEFAFEGRRAKGMYVGMADTGKVMEVIAQFWPVARRCLENDYNWTVYHQSHSHLFLTSDDPCQWDPKTSRVVMPLALDLALVGEIVPDGTLPSIYHSNASPALVAKINRATARGCESRVYAQVDTPELRQFTKKNHVDRDIMFCGRGFSNDGKPMTDDEVKNLMEHFERLRAKDRTKESVSK
jgi:hypothetical protein